MQYKLPRQAAIIGARRRERLTAVERAVSFCREEDKIRFGLVLTFFVAHVPLAILMSTSSRLATLHTFVTIIGALWLSMSSKKLEWVAYAAAYITGAEVLWRMTGAQSFWETGKYGVAAIFIVAMVRHWRVKPSIFPVLYFLLLLPSTFLTFHNLPLDESRRELSFNLSGPFALMVAGAFFSQLSLSRENLLRIFIALIGPIIGVAAIAFFGIATAEEIVFTAESSHAASGGFGPNQVSSILGLGALASFLILLDKDVGLRLKILCGGVMLFLAAQGALTFSRGGLYNVAGAIILTSFFLLKDSRTRIQFVLAILLVSAVAYFIIFPRLDSFTEGALSARFEDTSTSGREELARADLEIWFDNFIFGVGPGVATEHRSEVSHTGIAHTEFTRLLAEHGLYGLVALFVIVGTAARSLFKARTARERALIVAIAGWSSLYMLNAAMRLVAPSIMFGLAFAYFMPAAKETVVLSKHQGVGKVRRERTSVKNSGRALTARV
jgi:hypothetical protein